MYLQKSAIAIAAAALCVVGGAGSASAQQSCAGYYNQVMNAYQTLGPSSPRYNQMANDYTARCLSGATAQPGPAYYQAPYAYQQPQPAYAYPQPAYVDPAAALVGAAIVGGAVSGAFDNDDRGYRDGYRGGRW